MEYKIENRGERIISFPHFGREYTKIIKSSLENLGLNVQLPPKTTDRTIRLGVRNSSLMMCFPYKVTLGNFMEAIENGTNTLLIYDSLGRCRLRHYHKIQEYTLNNLNKDFEMYGINGKNVLRVLKKISGKSKVKIFYELYKLYKNLKEYDKQKTIWSSDKPNIGIIGEIYSCIEETVNYGIENKIKKYGINPYNTVTLSDFIKESIINKVNLFRIDKDKKYKKRANEYLNGEIGGHGKENIYNLLKLVDKKVDGIIHILPMTCFLGDTLLTTNNFNSKQIKDIRKGDLVLTHRGRFRKVEKTVSRNFEGEIFNVDCGGIFKFKITPEHPIFTLKRKNVKKGKDIRCSPSFIKVKELERNDFIAIPKPKKYSIKTSFKSDMINPKTPKYADINEFKYNKSMLRLLGYYLSEGSIGYDRHKTKNRKYIASVRFTFNKKEKNFMDDIKKIIRDNNIESYCKVYFRKRRYNAADLSISNRSLAYLLKRVGGEYCDKKEIHEEIMNLNPKLQLEITKGFFRGDGCFRDKYGETTYRAVTTSFKLAQQLFWILIRNNIKCSILEQNIKNRKKSWMIKLSNAESIKRMKDKLINPKERINNVKFLEIKNYFLIPIRKIKKEKFKGKVYNLKVEEDNSYVANFMAVHNCMPDVSVEPFINQICRENKIPLLRIPIDENFAEANLETRLETFCELIQIKRK